MGLEDTTLWQKVDDIVVKTIISAENVIFIDHNKKNIVEAIDKVRNDTNFIEMVNKCVSPYGNGNTTEKVIKVLKNLIIDNEFIYKNITY